jgi:uncharacterized Zn finger protein
VTSRVYGSTWWGRAFLDALTSRAGLDPHRLIRGRACASGDRVHDLHIIPGAIGAVVQGRHPKPYSVIVNVPVLDDAQWATLLDSMAAQVGHLAALLDGELPPAVATASNLLPGPGELGTACSCPDPIAPCEHAAAVCYRTAAALDTDPFVLLLLRGRTREEVLDALRDRRQPRWSAPGGMLAREAFGRKIAPLPPVALPPRQPGEPVSLPAPPPAASGVTSQELAALAAMAARRAWELLPS